jgi:class 3 adenylate cyclase
MNKSFSALAELIEERLKPGANAADVDRRILSMFGERWAIVFTDMCGFSRRAARQGIISFLVLIHQLNKLVHPVARRHAGFVLKTIADSHVILFRDPRQALDACVDLQQQLYRYNGEHAEPDRIYVGCGLGFGDCLKLGDEDIYGVEVNFAAKLGEDLAGPYQIFLTPSALKTVGRVAGVRFKKVPGGRLGGTKLPYFEAVYAPPRDSDVRRAKRQRVRFR